MAEQMSGLQPTEKDLEWYKQQQQESKPLLSGIIDKGIELSGLAGTLVQASPVLRTVLSGTEFVGEKIEQGRELSLIHI